jgi:outer membrane immunogenic protein
MKSSALLAVAAFAAGSAGAARAADLPMRSPPPAPYYSAPLFTWTGFYAGVNAGVNFGTSSGLVTPNGFTPANGFFNAGTPGNGFGPFRGSDPGIGFVGGGQIGYNVQSGMFVYGIEADLDYFGMGSGGNRTFSDRNVYTPANSTFTLYGRDGSGFLGTVRGRLGVAVLERTLLYVTGGLAYGDYGTTYRLGQFVNGAFPAATINYTANPGSDTRVGYAIGAGVEYAFTPQISGKAEYLYTDIGSQTYKMTNPGTGSYLAVKSDGAAQIARVGLNYKF